MTRTAKTANRLSNLKDAARLADDVERLVVASRQMLRAFEEGEDGLAMMTSSRIRDALAPFADVGKDYSAA